MRLKKQKGSALITLIIAMVLMAALSIGIYTLTTSSTFSELLASRDYNAYQLAKAGARYAASLIADNASNLTYAGWQWFHNFHYYR
jgi:Tfp pilus assembly protein PilX